MKNKSAVVFATWFGSGLIPPPKFVSGMAGTYGSLASLPLCFMVVWRTQPLHWIWYSFITFVIFWIGCVTVPRAEVALGAQVDWKGKTKTHDQNQIVIDETFGMLVTCYPLIFIPFDSYWFSLFLAFILFRFFDIVKVWPTSYFDKMEDAFGVMMDDGMAGVYAAICLTFILLHYYLTLLFLVALAVIIWLEERQKKKKFTTVN